MKTKAKGLGDTLARFTEKTGIKAIIEKVTDDCGCKKRQEKLNEVFPYNNK